MAAGNQFDLERLEREAPAEVEFHAVLDSTNDRALALARELPLGSQSQRPRLVLAERQAAGRGRGANRWWAAEGALTFSVLLDTSAFELPPARWPLASLTTGLAVCETLDQLAPQAWAALKWPNDVYLRERKVCGILIEAPPGPARRLVVGVGVNVNNRFAAAPPEVRDNATSLADATSLDFDLTDVLLRILHRLEARWRQLAVEDVDLPAAWQRWCLLTGRVAQVVVGERRIVGHCRGIAADGALLLQTAEGEERIVGGSVADWS